jgi:uncharacterized protein YqjF (DUF2071 family)
VDPQVVDGTCPLTVRRAVMVHRWEWLTFLHWPFEPGDVQGLLPAGLEVDTYDGQAWVGLVPFRMWVAPPRLPALPWLGRFCETNVRTYVRDRHGRTGVWFFSLEASRLAAVVAARTTYQLPYYWASMRLDRSPTTSVYTTRRRWPGPPGDAASAAVVVRPGEVIPADQVTGLEHFLTARWRLFSLTGKGSLRYADVEHPPWPLQRAVLEQCDETLFTATGLPAPVGEPLVHYSRGVEVRIGRPRAVR